MSYHNMAEKLWNSNISIPWPSSTTVTGKTIVYATVGAGVAILAGPTILGAVGFTKTDVVASSSGAKLMSLYGGCVPAGGLVATLQSVGATGILASPVVTTVTATTGAAVGFVCQRYAVPLYKTLKFQL